MTDEAKFTPITPIKLPTAMPAVRIRSSTPYGHLHITVVVDLKAGRPEAVVDGHILKRNFVLCGGHGGFLHGGLPGFPGFDGAPPEG